VGTEQRGYVIHINGIPSSGKSSVATEISRNRPGLTILAGDDVIRQVPYEERAAQAGRLFELTLEMIEELRGSANVIVDGAWTERQVLEAQERLRSAAMFVVLRIDESERSKRESLRRDRRLGHPWDPAWHNISGPNELYDLVIDSKTTGVHESAALVLGAAEERWPDIVW
jgi:chloramphenicol 3-O-phosphotransferase